MNKQTTAAESLYLKTFTKICDLNGFFDIHPLEKSMIQFSLGADFFGLKFNHPPTAGRHLRLGTQLIHRNDELALQYEKIKPNRGMF